MARQMTRQGEKNIVDRIAEKLLPTKRKADEQGEALPETEDEDRQNAIPPNLEDEREQTADKIAKSGVLDDLSPAAYSTPATETPHEPYTEIRDDREVVIKKAEKVLREHLSTRLGDNRGTGGLAIMMHEFKPRELSASKGSMNEDSVEQATVAFEVEVQTTRKPVRCYAAVIYNAHDADSFKVSDRFYTEDKKAFPSNAAGIKDFIDKAVEAQSNKTAARQLCYFDINRNEYVHVDCKDVDVAQAALKAAGFRVDAQYLGPENSITGLVYEVVATPEHYGEIQKVVQASDEWADRAEEKDPDAKKLERATPDWPDRADEKGGYEGDYEDKDWPDRTEEKSKVATADAQRTAQKDPYKQPYQKQTWEDRSLEKRPDPYGENEWQDRSLEKRDSEDPFGDWADKDWPDRAEEKGRRDVSKEVMLRYDKKREDAQVPPMPPGPPPTPADGKVGEPEDIPDEVIVRYVRQRPELMNEIAPPPPVPEPAADQGMAGEGGDMADIIEEEGVEEPERKGAQRHVRRLSKKEIVAYVRRHPYLMEAIAQIHRPNIAPGKGTPMDGMTGGKSADLTPWTNEGLDKNPGEPNIQSGTGDSMTGMGSAPAFTPPKNKSTVHGDGIGEAEGLDKNPDRPNIASGNMTGMASSASSRKTAGQPGQTQGEERSLSDVKVAAMNLLADAAWAMHKSDANGLKQKEWAGPADPSSGVDSHRIMRILAAKSEDEVISVIANAYVEWGAQPSEAERIAKQDIEKAITGEFLNKLPERHRFRMASGGPDKQVQDQYGPGRTATASHPRLTQEMTPEELERFRDAVRKSLDGPNTSHLQRVWRIYGEKKNAQQLAERVIAQELERAKNETFEAWNRQELSTGDKMLKDDGFTRRARMIRKAISEPKDNLPEDKATKGKEPTDNLPEDGDKTVTEVKNNIPVELDAQTGKEKKRAGQYSKELMTVAEVREVCPRCADKMESMGMKAVKATVIDRQLAVEHVKQLRARLDRGETTRFQNDDGSWKRMANPVDQQEPPSRCGGCMHYFMSRKSARTGDYHTPEMARNICTAIQKTKIGQWLFGREAAEVDTSPPKDNLPETKQTKKPDPPDQAKRDESFNDRVTEVKDNMPEDLNARTKKKSVRVACRHCRCDAIFDIFEDDADKDVVYECPDCGAQFTEDDLFDMEVTGPSEGEDRDHEDEEESVGEPGEDEDGQEAGEDREDRETNDNADEEEDEAEDICPQCGIPVDECECDICPECGGVIGDEEGEHGASCLEAKKKREAQYSEHNVDTSVYELATRFEPGDYIVLSRDWVDPTDPEHVVRAGTRGTVRRCDDNITAIFGNDELTVSVDHIRSVPDFESQDPERFEEHPAEVYSGPVERTTVRSSRSHRPNKREARGIPDAFPVSQEDNQAYSDRLMRRVTHPGHPFKGNDVNTQPTDYPQGDGLTHASPYDPAYCIERIINSVRYDEHPDAQSAINGFFVSEDGRWLSEKQKDDIVRGLRAAGFAVRKPTEGDLAGDYEPPVMD